MSFTLTTNKGFVSPIATTFAIGTAVSGNLMVVGVANTHGLATISTVSDSVGTSYQKFELGNSGNGFAIIWGILAGSGANTLAVTWSNSTFADNAVFGMFSGTSIAGVNLDGLGQSAAPATATAITSGNAPSLTTVDNDDLLINFIYSTLGGASFNSPWSTISSLGNSCSLGYQADVVPGTYAPNATVTGGTTAYNAILEIALGVPVAVIGVASLEYHLSATTLNAASLGGAISGTLLTSGAANNLWNDVTSGQSSSGETQYRCIYIKNTDASLTWGAPVVWIDGAPAVGSAAIALDATAAGTGANTTSHITGSDTSAPSPALTWHDTTDGTPPTTEANGLTITENIAPGQAKAIWLRRTIPANNPTSSSDAVSIRIEGLSP